MGNNASSPKANGSGAASPGRRSSLHRQHHSQSQHYQNNHQHQQQSQQYQQHSQSQPQQQQHKGPARNPTLVQNQRVAAAPPEQSMAQAQGSTTSSSSASRAIPSRPYTTAAEAAVAASASPSRNANSASAAAASKPAPLPANTTPPPSKPVAVPQPSSSTYGPGTGSATIPIATPAAVAATTNAYAAEAEHVEQAAHQPLDYNPPLSPYPDSMDVPLMAHNSMQDVSYLTRPPRLPLPIEEEVHTPGSPIIAPAMEEDLLDDIEALDSEGLTHRSSTLSSVVNDDDEEELRVDKTRPTVPTRLEWLRGGEKVYVTGTIFQWNKKQRMHPVEGRPGVFATTINVLPGTHHIRFLVDNQMETSRDLPTTVDFGNNLVNYIEVAPQNTPPKAHPGVPSPAALGAPVVALGGAGTGAPGGGLPDGHAGHAAAVSQKQVKQPEHQQQHDQAATQAPASSSSTAHPQEDGKLLAADSSVELTNRAPKWKDVPDASAFSHDLPQYLVDYDQPDESPDFHSAAVATEILSMPPSLPGFLGKPILNAATLIKDDNSVLNMPNYTILNHLATSSIKNNILAVSATTRYKAKFVTIIIYKPTGGDDKQ